MKFQRTAKFAADFKCLPREHQQLFLALIRAFNAACDAYVADPSVGWPAALRVSRMVGTADIWEMTWSFSGPDGRATFQIVDLDGEPAVLWRRIGSHAIYKNP